MAGSSIEGDVDNNGNLTLGAESSIYGDVIADTGLVTNSGNVTMIYGSSINGAYDSTTTGDLYIQLGGKITSPLITNGGTVSGTLYVTYVNSFVPTVGERFEVIGGGSSTGTFANVFGGFPEYISGNVYLSLQPPDMAMTSAAISSNGKNVNATYTISGAMLASAGTVDFYWATGPDISDAIETTPLKQVTTKTAVGTYTATTTIASLGAEPANASYILAVADSPARSCSQRGRSSFSRRPISGYHSAATYRPHRSTIRPEGFG